MVLKQHFLHVTFYFCDLEVALLYDIEVVAFLPFSASRKTAGTWHMAQAAHAKYKTQLLH